MSQLNPRPQTLFRTKLKDWQAAFRARKAQLAALLGEDPPPQPPTEETTASPAATTPASTPVIRDKKLANRKRVRTRS